MTVTSPRDEERIIAILRPGAIVGELSMIDGMPRSASVAALRDSVLRFVSRESFKQCADANPGTHLVLLTIEAARLRQVDEALAATTFLTVKARVARALIELAEHIGQSSEGHIVFSERISQGDLAAMAGVARENVSRVLSEWRRRKFVTGSPSRYCLINIAALKREINDGRTNPRASPQERFSSASGMGRKRVGGGRLGPMTWRSETGLQWEAERQEHRSGYKAVPWDVSKAPDSAATYPAPRSLISFSVSSVNSRLNLRRSTPQLWTHLIPFLHQSELTIRGRRR